MGPLSNELLLEIVSLSAHGILIVDAQSPELEIIYANSAYEDLSGYSARELVGFAWLKHAAADDETPELVRLRQSVSCNDAGSLSLPFLRKDGEIWLGRLRLTPLKCMHEDRRLMLIEHLEEERTSGDSAELLKRALGLARRKIASLDRMDPVTGLLSRAQFKIMLRREIAVSRREKRSLHLMFFAVPDIDAYRSTFGDNAADSCLRMIGAQILGTFRRAADLSARVEQSTIAVAVHGQTEKQIRQLIALVEKKVRNLGLHNPRGRIGRYVIVKSVVIKAEPGLEDADALIDRGLVALECPTDEESAIAVNRS